MATNTLTNGTKQQDTRATNAGPAQRAYDNAALHDAHLGLTNNPHSVTADAGQIAGKTELSHDERAGASSARAWVCRPAMSNPTSAPTMQMIIVIQNISPY